MTDLNLTSNQLQSRIIDLQGQLEKLSRDRIECIEEAKSLRSSLNKIQQEQTTNAKECQVLRWTSKELKEKLIPITEENTQLNSRIKDIETEYSEYMGIMEQHKIAHDKQEAIIADQRINFQKKKLELQEWTKKIENLKDIIMQYKEKKKDDKYATQ